MSFPEDALHLYGTPLHVYRGTGQLTLSTSHKPHCQFIAGQLDNGKTVMLCATPHPFMGVVAAFAPPKHFTGSTDEGFEVVVDHIVSETRYLPEATAQGSYFALRVGHLQVSKPRPRIRRQLSFLLTNVRGVSSVSSFSSAGIHVVLRPLEGVSTTLARLEVTRGVLPTAELHTLTRASISRVEEAVDETCYLLSIALGTKVQWIALTESTTKGTWISRHHYSRVTKRYGTLSVLDTRGSDVTTLLQASSDGRFSRAKQNVGLTGAAIDTYLDAKAEGDYLEVRALKLVVSVEMLKAGYLDRISSTGLILNPEVFEPRLPRLKAAIKSALEGLTSEQRSSIYENLRALNRVTFSTQLELLCNEVGMLLGPGELGRFVASRNKLVHEGHFYCEKCTPQERAKLAPLADVYHEWFWLLHFTDRLFLRAIGYEGPYIDWTMPSSPEPRHLSPVAQPGLPADARRPR